VCLIIRQLLYSEVHLRAFSLEPLSTLFFCLSSECFISDILSWQPTTFTCSNRYITHTHSHSVSMHTLLPPRPLRLPSHAIRPTWAWHRREAWLCLDQHERHCWSGGACVLSHWPAHHFSLSLKQQITRSAPFPSLPHAIKYCSQAVAES